MPAASASNERELAPTAGDGGRAFAAFLAKKRLVIESYLARSAARPEAGEPASEQLEHYLYAPLERFGASGGKRTRPALVLLGCEAVGGDAARALSSAAAIEDFQSAALIHDDIADAGELRRGEPCTYLVEGTGPAINIGDLGIVRTFCRVLEDEALDGATKLRVLDELARMEQRTVEGQALDLGWVRDERWDVACDDYLAMATHKTAYYSAASPLAIGAICGGGNDAQVEALFAFGLDAGLAFQLQDDLLNLVGDAAKQGKDYRSDITEGKRTLAVTWALEHLEGDARAELVKILSAHTAEPTHLERAVQIMEEAGAIDHVRDRARELAASSRQRLAAVDFDAAAREVLFSMADFFVERAG